MSVSHHALANPAAELALLAATCRASPEQRVQWCIEVSDDWFTSADRITGAMVIRDLVNRSLPIDLTLLKDSLRAHLPDAACDQLADSLSGALPSADLWRPIAERVRDYYVRRRGCEAADAAKARFLNLTTPSADALEAAEGDFLDLHQRRADRGMRHISASLDDARKSIIESLENRGYVTGGLPFGFTDFDRSYIKGARPGHVIMYVAPPGGGKTVAMMKTAWNVAAGTGDYEEYARAVAWATLKENPKHLNYLPSEVGVYSFEMDDVQLAERLLIQQARVEMAKMHRGQMSRKDQQQIEDAFKTITSSRLHIDHVPGLSIQELRARARYDVMRYKLKLICIDYAQLITSTSKEARSGNRTQEMMDVSKGLKLLAQECKVPVIVCAQPKQETWGMRAQLNAMAETAQLAKDADLVVMFGFWDKIAKQIEGLEKKTKQDLAGDSDNDDHEDREADDPRCFAYADIVKNRHGPNTTGKAPIKLLWERDFFDFVSTNKRLFDSTGKETQQ